MAITERDGGVWEDLDEGFHLLRALPARAWAYYFAGAAPFSLAVLWAASPAGVSVPLGSFFCAIAFVSLQFFRLKFAAEMERQKRPGQADTGTPRKTLRSLCFMAALQPFKLVLLPLAAAAVLPLAWMVAFFRNLTVLAGRPEPGKLVSRAAALAGGHARRNWLVLLLLFSMGVVVFLNFAVLLALLPALTRMLTGYENQYTRGTGGFFGPLLFEVAFAAAWMIVDPLAQAVHTNRIFLTESRKDGVDLLVALRRGMVAVAVLMCGSLCSADVPPPAIERNIREVLNDRGYAWHTGKESAGEKKDWIDRAAESIRWAMRGVGQALQAVGEWIRRIVAQRSPAENLDKAAPPRAGPRLVTYALLGVFAVGLVVFLVKSRRTQAPLSVLTAQAPPDLSDEAVGAEVLPEEGWLSLSGQAAARGEYRVALRALYLATLANLAQRDLLKLERAKTNRDYQRELRRRSADERLNAAFRESVRSFEQSWYGRHRAGETEYAGLLKNFHAVREHAG